MLKALSLTLEASTWICSRRVRRLVTAYGRQAYTRLLGEAAQRPLADLGRSVDRAGIGVLDKRLADDVDGESLRRLDVFRRVLQPTGVVQARD